jgi:hypothetical protein
MGGSQAERERPVSLSDRSYKVLVQTLKVISPHRLLLSEGKLQRSDSLCMEHLACE